VAVMGGGVSVERRVSREEGQGRKTTRKTVIGDQ
jgi:hypothetical protein